MLVGISPQEVSMLGFAGESMWDRLWKEDQEQCCFFLSCTHVIEFRARLVQTLPLCIALSPELIWNEVDNCVFPSLAGTRLAPLYPFQFVCLGFASSGVSQ